MPTTAIVDAIVMSGIVILAVAFTVVSLSSDDWLLRRLAFLKRQDRYLGYGRFFIVIAACLSLETLLFWWIEAPLDLAMIGLGLTAYLPATFFFYCNVFHVGIRRELMWSCFFVICCLASMLVFRWLRLELIVPACIMFTAFLCRASWRDPYCWYRRGLRLLDNLGQPAAAAEAFNLARSKDPEDLRYPFHLGRAMIRMGDREEGNQLIQAAFRQRPDFMERLSTDPLLQRQWLDSAACDGSQAPQTTSDG